LFAEPARASGAAADQAFRVWHKPPGLLLRGEPASLSVTVEPTGVHPRGEAYVRGEDRAGFTRVPLVWDERQGRLVAQVWVPRMSSGLRHLGIRVFVDQAAVPRRFRRRTAASSAGVGGAVRPVGGVWARERCGRWVL
jgi:hypothetical protein